MKKLLILLLIFSAFTASAQVRPYQIDPAYGRQISRYKVIDAFSPPAKDSLQTNTSDTAVQFFYYTKDTSFYGYSTAKGFFKVGGGGSDSLSFRTLTVNADSTRGKLSKPNGEVDSFEVWANGFVPSGVLSVTGTAVDNTDPHNPVINSTGTNLNIGSGYRLAVPFTNNIKTIYAVSPILLDSVTNTNALTFKFDTTVIHTTAWNNGNYGSLSQQNTNTSNIATNTTAIAGKQNTITLTTTGSSGAATLSGSTLNIPQYTGGSGTVTGGSITWPGTLYSTPTTGSVSSGNLTFSPSLASQSAYTLLGNRTSGSATPTFFTNPFIDSVKLSTDTLFGRINNAWIFQFKSPAFANWQTNGSAIYTDATGVGIGTNTPQSKLNIEGSTNSGSTAVLDSSGITLSNSSIPDASHLDGISMPIIFASKHYASGTIQNFKYKIQAEGSVLRILYNNGASYGTLITIANNGNLSTAGLIASSGPGLSTFNSAIQLSSAFTFGNVGGNTSVFNSYDFRSVKSVLNNNSTGSTGSEFNSFLATNTINNTVGTTTVRGFYYNPTVTSLTGTTLIGFQNEVGNNFFNTTSGGTGLGQTTTIPSNRIFQVAATTQVSHPNPNMTTSQRDAITGVTAGDTIFCTDCTATDSSTGVTQTYNGSTWKNLW